MSQMVCYLQKSSKMLGQNLFLIGFGKGSSFGICWFWLSLISCKLLTDLRDPIPSNNSLTGLFFVNDKDTLNSLRKLIPKLIASDR